MSEHTETYEDYIRLLTHELLLGIISPENKAILEKAIREEPKARAICKKAISHFEDPAIQDLRNNWKKELVLPEEIATAILDSAVNKHFSRKRVLLSVAALLAGVIVIGSYILFSNKTTVTDIVQAKEITLQVAGGQEIKLSSATGQLQAGNVTLNNNGSALSYQTNTNAPVTSGLNTLTVPAGLNYKLDLADGSKIWLNSATTLQFPFSFNGASREITINGEAYLEIAPDAGKPFLVHLPGNNTVQVLGTTFNINTYDSSKAHVALVTGAVKVNTAAGNSLQLKPGYEAIAADSKLQSRPFDADNLLAWREGKYYFTNATLQEVSEVLARWYGITVIIDAPATAKKEFTGNLYRHNPIEKFLSGIHLLMDVDYYYQNGILHIK